MKTRNFLHLFPNVSVRALGEKMREEREKLGKTHDEIYGTAYSREMVRLVERGEYHPSLELVQALGKATKWDYRAFLLLGYDGPLKLRRANFDRVVSLFLELPETAKEVVAAMPSAPPVHRHGDLRKAWEKHKPLRSDPLACYFLLQVLAPKFTEVRPG
jgi:hypothetical protein